MGSVTPHRATYIRELGIWYATCRECAWVTSDVHRRRAMSLFRLHIQERREAEALGQDQIIEDQLDAPGAFETVELDLRDAKPSGLMVERNVELQTAKRLRG